MRREDSSGTDCERHRTGRASAGETGARRHFSDVAEADVVSLAHHSAQGVDTADGLAAGTAAGDAPLNDGGIDVEGQGAHRSAAQKSKSARDVGAFSAILRMENAAG